MKTPQYLSREYCDKWFIANFGYPLGDSEYMSDEEYAATLLDYKHDLSIPLDEE